MSVFKENDIIIHDCKVAIIQEIDENNEEVWVKFDSGVSISLDFDNITVVDRKVDPVNGKLDSEADYWLLTQDNFGTTFKFHIRKTTVSIFDLKDHKTGNIGDKILHPKQKHEIYTITPQDQVFLQMLDFFDDYWFTENLADIEEVCNWFDCVKNFVDVDSTWTKCSVKKNDVVVDQYFNQIDDLREEYHQMKAEQRQNFWRE